jgi:hypothetical protein
MIANYLTSQGRLDAAITKTTPPTQETVYAIYSRIYKPPTQRHHKKPALGHGKKKEGSKYTHPRKKRTIPLTPHPLNDPIHSSGLGANPNFPPSTSKTVNCAFKKTSP